MPGAPIPDSTIEYVVDALILCFGGSAVCPWAKVA